MAHLLLRDLQREFPALKKHKPSKTQKEVFEYLSDFVKKPSLMAASIIQNPFSIDNNLEPIGKKYGNGVLKHIRNLNKLKDNDVKFVQNYNTNKKIILLYLANFKFINKSKKKDGQIKKVLAKKNIRYAMSLLEKSDVSEIRHDLEDVFFSILEPEIYRNYINLLKFTKKKLAIRQNEILQHFSKILKENRLNRQIKIETRVKSIYSIHNKIIKKNILYTQILDTIGLRILVPTEELCYKVMVLILKNQDFMMSKIKDYIAIPKENGYQSIHLTIIHKNFPVEIQIRTYDMHWKAQYGIASHANYKNKHHNQ